MDGVLDSFEFAAPAVFFTIVALLLAALLWRRRESLASVTAEGVETAVDKLEPTGEGEPVIEEQEDATSWDDAAASTAEDKGREDDSLDVEMSGGFPEAEPAESEMEKEVNEGEGGEDHLKYRPGKLRGSRLEMMMTKEEREEEQRVQREQLAAIFQLLQAKRETFGEMSPGDMEEQLKLYSKEMLGEATDGSANEQLGLHMPLMDL
ncbi:FILIA-N KH-like domain-containing protein [Erpetoichthys calabaricus]|uniref:FILIA-N KH-like domain-containing protein n=1 Tax=Erpetoichthys calabaricus TaxID=27687 RepID=UPI0022341251|nr:FILIA-N KH-like domain-containing protein [Erpetoichthys calabaricus]